MRLTLSDSIFKNITPPDIFQKKRYYNEDATYRTVTRIEFYKQKEPAKPALMQTPIDIVRRNKERSEKAKNNTSSTSHKTKEDVARAQKKSHVSGMQVQVTIEKAPDIKIIQPAPMEPPKAQRTPKEKTSTSAARNMPSESASSLDSITTVLTAPSKLLVAA